jgi:hypothetical protein
MSMFFIEGACPICGTGTRGFRLCSDEASVVVMCDECEATWLDAERVDASDVVYAEPPEYVLPGRACSIAAPSSRWATRAEIDASGWGNLIAGEGTALDGG